MKSAFLYFQEGKALPDVKAAGLSYAFDVTPSYKKLDADRSPSGEKGLLLGDKRLPSQLFTYAPDSQTWRKIPQQEGVWVGMWNDHRPGPTDLHRSQQIHGTPVELCDGNKWNVPIVRDQNQGTQLPMFIDMNDEGEWITGQMTTEHQVLWEQVIEFMEAVIAYLTRDGDTIEEKTLVSLDHKNLIPAAINCLKANYHVSTMEVILLKIFNTNDSPTAVLCAAADWDEFMSRVKDDDAKKNDLNDSAVDGTGTTKDGNSSASPDTGQPALT